MNLQKNIREIWVSNIVSLGKGRTLKKFKLLRHDDGNKYENVCGTLKKLWMFSKKKLLVKSINVSYDEHLR